MPRGMDFLLCRPNLRESALLDRAQGAFETPRQRGRSDASIQRFPPCRKLRVIDGCASGELLGFDDERLGASQHPQLLRPALDALLRLIESGQATSVFPSVCAQRAKLAAQKLQFARRDGRIRPPEPFAQPVLELHTCSLLCV